MRPASCSEADDLFRIGTMSFQGEQHGVDRRGLAGSRCNRASADQERQRELFCNGGELSERRPWNGSPGTRLEVRHLFFNTPVRKKFLKTHSTELGHIIEAVQRIGLAHPNLHIVLALTGSACAGSLSRPSSRGLLDRVRLVLRQRTAKSSMPS